MSRRGYASPEDAEAAFYDAIERADLDTMMDVWADDEEIVCVHPTGQRLVGHEAVREGWRTVFTSGKRFSIRVSETVRWHGGLFAVHNVIETIFVAEDPDTPHGPLVATNVYQRGALGWVLLSHHASPSDEEAGAPPAGIQRTLH